MDTLNFFRRFTTLLAEKAKHVTAVDIVESFIEENRRINGHFRNVSFKTGEASQLKFPSARWEYLKQLFLHKFDFQKILKYGFGVYKLVAHVFD